jgi:hypothetical protein
MATAAQKEPYLGRNVSSNCSEKQKVSFNFFTSDQLVHNSGHKQQQQPTSTAVV